MLFCKFNDLEDLYPVDFSQSGHVITLTSTVNLPEDTSGFVLTREGKSDNWDYSEFKTIYRVIDKKNIQWSDDGSVYVPPTKTVVFQIIWNDQNDAYGVRPESVEITVYKNGKKSVIKTLTEKNNWKYTAKDRLASDEFTMTAPKEQFYELNISGTTGTYSIAVPQPRVITEADEVAALCQIFEASKDASGWANIYASQCENNTKNFNDVPKEIQKAVEKVINDDLFVVNPDGTTSLKPINTEVE